jgi:tRNA threonylcarbamoyl adenosine modification protein YeaZ
MFYLVLETSSTFGILALFENERILSSKIIPSAELSAKLMPSVENLFLENNSSIQSLDFIAVGTGPGSFTGTRIGIVSAKAIAYSLNLPIVEFCSLTGFIPVNPPEDFSILSDAKSGQVYQLDVSKESHHLVKFNDPIIRKLSSISLDEHHYFSSDLSLLKNNPKIQETTFNLDMLGNIINSRFSKKTLTNSFDLKPIYLKNP